MPGAPHLRVDLAILLSTMLGSLAQVPAVEASVYRTHCQALMDHQAHNNDGYNRLVFRPNADAQETSSEELRP